nr:hypothetical protein [Tanacetum cinerariifolium]
MDVFQQTTKKKHPTVLYKTPRLLEKLEQSIFLSGRKDISHCRGLPHKRSEGWDASSKLVLCGGCASLDTHRTPIQKQPEVLLCMVGLSQRYFLRDDVYLICLDDDDRDMDLFNLISSSNPTKVKTGTRYCVAHEVPLLTVTAIRVIDIEDVAGALESLGTPSTIKKSPLDFANEDQPQIITEWVEQKIKRDYDTFRPAQSTHGGKSIASMGLDADSLLSTPAAQDLSTATKSMSDPKPLSYVNSLPHLEKDIAQKAFLYPLHGRVVGRYLPTGVGRDAQDACQGMVDHIVPSGYFFELRHLPNAEVRLLKKARSMIARRDQRIQAKEREIKKIDQEMHGLQNQTKNLKTLIKAEVDMKKYAEAKNAKMSKELDSLRAQFSDLQCAEIYARLDKLSMDFDEELYLHMLTAIAVCRWVIRHGLRLVVMKCAESSKIRQAFADVILVYPEVRGPEDLWAVREEMLLEDAITANISRTEKKKKCRVGLAIFLADAVTQTEAADQEEPHPIL